MGNVFRVINCDGDIEISIYKKANAVFKTNEYNEIEDVCIHKEIINIFDLLKENQELKSQLKGTTHCFDEEEHKKLKDGQMVLIDDDCYKFNKEKEKFYVPTDFSAYRVIHTYDMNLTCYILSDYKELNKEN